MIGNSSSGIIEAPAFGVPTVNIGFRQRGRLAADSILHCATDRESIRQAIDRAVSPDFLELCHRVVSPYGQGNASRQIVRVIEKFGESTPKHFYDLEFDA